jgi:hypothetical protein
MPRGFRHVARSISFLSPIARRPDAFFATKIASLILRPDLRFFSLTSFQSFNRPSLSLGSSSWISLRRQSSVVSRPRLRPPGNIHRRSRLLRTNKTRPRLAATSLDDFAIPRPTPFKNESSALILFHLLRIRAKLSRNERPTMAARIRPPRRSLLVASVRRPDVDHPRLLWRVNSLTEVINSRSKQTHDKQEHKDRPQVRELGTVLIVIRMHGASSSGRVRRLLKRDGAAVATLDKNAPL